MPRANYDLPDDVLIKVRELSGATTKREAIVIALNEYIKKKKIEKLIQSAGKIKLSWTKSSLKAYRG